MIESKKKKKKPFPRWLTLNIYNNCFNDGLATHLGIYFRSQYYVITHSDGINAYLIDKSGLKMKELSTKPEYLKECLRKPLKLHSTRMQIREDILVKAILFFQQSKT